MAQGRADIGSTKPRQGRASARAGLEKGQAMTGQIWTEQGPQKDGARKGPGQVQGQRRVRGQGKRRARSDPEPAQAEGRARARQD